MKLKQWFADNYRYLLLLAALAAVLVFLFFPARASYIINYDSSYQYFLTQQSLGDIWALLPADYSPPLYALLLKLFCMLFGHTLYVMRVFNLLPVVGMLALALFPVRRIFSTRAGVLCALFSLLSSCMLHYLPEVRPTVPAMFIMMAVTVYACDLYISRSRRAFITFTAVSVIALYTHNIAMLGTFGVYCALLADSLLRKQFPFFKRVLASGVVTAVVYVPWLVVLLAQTGNVRKNFWVGSSSLLDVAQWVFASPVMEYTMLVFPVLAAVIIAAGAAVYLIGRRSRKRSGKLPERTERDKEQISLIKLLALMVAFSVVVYILFNFYIKNVNTRRYCFIIGMEWIVLAAVLADRYLKPIFSYALAAVMGLSAGAQTCSIDVLTEQATLPEMIEKLGDQPVFLHYHEWSLGMMLYYFPEGKHYVCDDTYTILTTYDCFGKGVVTDIGAAGNIGDYAEEFIVFDQTDCSFSYAVPELEEKGYVFDDLGTYTDPVSFVPEWHPVLGHAPADEN